jgi:cysteine desulfurase
MQQNGNIYLDHGASTPVRLEVLTVMQPYWTKEYGNPSAVHRHGQVANQALEEARQSVARTLNARSDEIIFTGCGSESDNLALRGVMFAARAAGRGNHLITSIVEHKAVLDTARQLRDLFGFQLTILPVDQYGQVDPAEMEAAINPETVLISIMAANNEIGTIQPIDRLGEIARTHGVLFHTDAIQSAAVTDWDMQALPVDLLSLAPHKFYGPKGIGILYIKRGTDLIPSLTGGGQEGGRRAGTANVPFAVGAAEALRLAALERQQTVAHYRRLTNGLIDGLIAALPDTCRLTGHPVQRLPHNASFAFRDISGNDLLMHLDMAGVSASSGSACLTGDPKPSSILEALGLGSEWTKGGLRLTVGRQNTVADIALVLELIPGLVRRLQRLQEAYA